MLEFEAASAAADLEAEDWAHVGSSYICNTDGSDFDWLFLVKDIDAAKDTLLDCGYKWDAGGYDPDESRFYSFKKSFDGLVLNAIVIKDKDYFYAFQTAAEVCRYLDSIGVNQVRYKSTRIAIHKIVRDDLNYNEV